MLFEEAVNQVYTKLNENEQMVVNKLLMNKGRYAKLTLQELAKEMMVSNSFLVRLSKKIGFSGFSELRFQLKNEENTLKKIPDDTLVQHIFESDLLNTKILMENSVFSTVVNLMLSSRNIFTFGSGYAQQIMLEDFKRGMVYCNRFVSEIHTTKELRINAAKIHKGDLLFVVSLSGQVPTIMKELDQLNLKGANVVSVTLFQPNPLAAAATHNLYVQSTPLLKSETEAGYYSYVPLSLLLDSLVREYLVRNRKAD